MKKGKNTGGLSPKEKKKKTSNNSILKRFSSLGKGKKILAATAAGSLLLVFLLYFGFAVYFSKHFYFGTKINQTDCSGLTAQAADNSLISNLETYSLTLEEADNKTEQITSKQIDMKTTLETDLSDLKSKQNPFAWPACIFKNYSYEAEVSLKYDELKLSEAISSLECMKEENMKEAANASIEYNEKKKEYSVVDEQQGTKIDKTKVAELITKAVDDLKTTFNLRDEGCYQEPEIKADSEKITNALETLNKYNKSSIAYNILGNKETISSDTFRSWIKWNDNFEISIDSTAANDMVSSWANKYNTAGKEKILDTSYGTPVTISKGSYGWKINVKDTASELIEALKTGESVEKEPVFSTKAASTDDPAKDYGNSYVEINLGTQHLYLYVNGSLVIETDFVSGKVTNGNATPVGIYPLTYKQSPAVLRGADYTSPVTYWMPFNGGVGMHDATWRNKFGGNIYYNSGSHGCINLPLSAAKTIYQNVTAGMPVIVYDLKIEAEQPVQTLSPEEQLAADMEQPLDAEQPDVNNDEVPSVDVSNTGQGSTVVSTPAPVATPAPAAPTPQPAKPPTPVPTTAPDNPPVPTPSTNPGV